MDGANLPSKKRWVILYPIYINSKKTLAQGRRITAAKACEDPTCAEIRDCCNYLKIPSDIEEDKAYPRDFMQRGRVRVALKREDGSLVNPAIASRKQLMLRVAELIPKHHGRAKKQESSASASAAVSSKPSAPGSSKPSSTAGSSKPSSTAGSSKPSSTAGSSKSGKGGRKKK